MIPNVGTVISETMKDYQRLQKENEMLRQQLKIERDNNEAIMTKLRGTTKRTPIPRSDDATEDTY